MTDPGRWTSAESPVPLPSPAGGGIVITIYKLLIGKQTLDASRHSTPGTSTGITSNRSITDSVQCFTCEHKQLHAMIAEGAGGWPDCRD
jgi:hypothetical protein